MKNSEEKQKIREIKKITKEIIYLIRMKGRDYQDSCFKLGDAGFFVRIFDKVNRLKSLVWDKKKREVNDETVDDSIRDLIGYGLLWLYHRKQGKKNV